MSVRREDINRELERLLAPGQFKDYCPNGLQVEGRDEVARLVTGVTASQALIDAAIEQEADMLLVHHGFFWRGEDPNIIGVKGRRIRSLLANDINLFAYHLPLDAHPELGNNVQLAKRLGLAVEGPLGDSGEEALVFTGAPQAAMTVAELEEHLTDRLQRAPVVVVGERNPIRRIAWCTGAAQGFIELAIAAGADAYISGEISEQTTHVARENGIHFFAAGHHATERYGVQAVGEYLKEKFGLQHQFIDIDNPA